MLKIQTNAALVENFINDYTDDIVNKLTTKINRGLHKTKKRQAVVLSNKEQKILQKFNNKRTIKLLMSSNPKSLRKIIAWILKKYPSFHDKSSKVYKILYNVFVDNGYEKIDKYNFIKNIELKSCAYCNRSYIFTISKNANLKPEIDHFYPKHIYPYLAMSYYNLIPSCPTCNSFGAKGTRDSFMDKLKNPYEIEENDFKFTFDIQSIKIINNSIDDSSIGLKLKTLAKANDTYFQLTNLYQEHKDIVIELYQKLYQENTKMHFQTLLASLNDIKLDENEIYRLILGGYKNECDLHRRPMSKFIKDISEELLDTSKKN